MRPHLTVIFALGILAGCGDDPQPALDLAVEPDLTATVDMATPPPDLAPNPCDVDAGVPPALECTGLYANFAQKTIAPTALPYAPGTEFWSDGAKKSRWIELPAGTTIDVTKLHDWVFPTGTKLWKEFRLELAGVEKRVETRLFWKRGEGDWVGAVYRWNDTETAAPRLTTGLAAVPGTTYEIPAENRCVACHLGKTDRPLGFEAVSLAEPTTTGLGWEQLKSTGKVTATNANAMVAASSLQIPGSATERAALAYLHVNCGVSCHKAGSSGLFELQLEVSSGAAPASVMVTKAFGSINILSTYVPMGSTGNYYRIRPTDAAHSTVRTRMDLRDAPAGTSGIAQMPPLLTHTKDTAGLAAIDAWIAAMTAAPYPAPGAL